MTLLVALEIGLRVAAPTMAEEIFEFDPELGYRPAADRQIHARTGVFLPRGCDNGGMTHTITTNGIGERVVPASRPDQPYSLVVLGDSCSFGWDVSDEETFANRLAERANEEDRGLSVRLLAVPGYSSLEGYLLYQLRVASPPDIAVIAYGANDEDAVDASPWRGGMTDVELHGVSDGRPGRVPAAVRWRMVLGKSPLLSLVARARQGRGSTEAGDGERRLTPGQTSEALGRLVDLMQAQGVSILLHDLCSSSRTEQVQEVALAHGLPFVDTDAAMRRQWRELLSRDDVELMERETAGRFTPECLASHPEMVVTTDDFHPNLHGSRIVADVLWPHVREALTALETSATTGAQ